jgi:hypothetical protein
MGSLSVRIGSCLVALALAPSIADTAVVAAFGAPLPRHGRSPASPVTFGIDGRQVTTPSHTDLFMMDPATWTAAITTGVASLEPVATAGIALVSAAAGAASAIPRIQALEQELAVVRAALDASEAAYQAKLEELEETLFQLDKEYESQTATLKKEWDRQKANELNALRKKLQEEMQFKLSLEVEKEKSKVLTQTALQWNGFSTDKGAQLTQMRVQQTQLEASKAELERALQESLQELERLHTSAGTAADGTKKKLFGLF